MSPEEQPDPEHETVPPVPVDPMAPIPVEPPTTVDPQTPIASQPVAAQPVSAQASVAPHPSGAPQPAEPTQPVPHESNQVLSDIHASVHRQEQAIESLRGELSMILERLKEFAGDLLPTSAPARPQPVAQAAAAGDTNWDQVIFGQEMATDMSLASDRRSMIDGLISEQPASMGLVGQLLVFRSATSERMPQLLKDVGEAYYRWRPETQHGNDPMRDALVLWLGRICDANGVANTIEIVTPGDRYDAARHHAKERGIEVDSVFGWVVLRDNGKVYTKAAVSVK